MYDESTETETNVYYMNLNYIDPNGNIQTVQPIHSTADIEYDSEDENINTVYDKLENLKNTIENRGDIVGTHARFIYINNGVPTQSTANVGDFRNPLYINNGEITASSATIGSPKQPIYLENGIIKPIRESYRVGFLRMIDEASKNNPLTFTPTTEGTVKVHNIKTLTMSDDFLVWGDVTKNYDLDNTVEYGDQYNLAPLGTNSTVYGNVVFKFRIPISMNTKVTTSTLILVRGTYSYTNITATSNAYFKPMYCKGDYDYYISIPFFFHYPNDTIRYFNIACGYTFTIQDIGIQYICV